MNQRWSLRDAARQERRIFEASLRPAYAPQKCLDATQDGRLILYGCHGGGNQRFVFEYGWTAIQVQSGGCLTAARSNAPVRIASCTGGGEQRWNVSPSGEIRHNSGGCLDVSGGGQNDGAEILRFECHGQANQRFMPQR